MYSFVQLVRREDDQRVWLHLLINSKKSGEKQSRKKVGDVVVLPWEKAALESSNRTILFSD